MTLSTTVVEYMTAFEVSKKALWLRGLIGTFGIIHESVQVGIQSVIHLAKDHMYHTKHIDVRYHQLRHWVVVEKVIDLVKISTKKNPTDMMTKIIPVEKFRAYINFINILQM